MGITSGLLALFAMAYSGGGVQSPAPETENLVRIWSGDFTVAGESPPALRVVSWNIDRGKRLEEIAAVLESQNPSLFLLQEVDFGARRSGNRNIAEELARRLRSNYIFAPEFQELSQGAAGASSYQGQAILTQLPAHSVRMIRFRQQSGFWAPRPYLPDWAILQRRLGGRIALIAELQWAGHTLVVYNAHLESRSLGRIQLLQLDELLADTLRYPPDTPMILAGDLNTKYNAAAFAHKLRQAGWRSAFATRTPRTHVFAGSLDWILVRGPLTIEDGLVLRSAQGSDHFPISTKLAISPPTGR